MRVDNALAGGRATAGGFRTMYWFLVDETNRNYEKNKFFIMGGLVFTNEQVPLVDQAVREIRKTAGYLPGDSFKFDTNSRPQNVTIEDAKEAKIKLIDKLDELEVRMITYLVLHNIANKTSVSKTMQLALNSLSHLYFKLLTEEKAYGIMLMDRDDKSFDHLEHLFQCGLIFDKQNKMLDPRIKLFGMTNDNASHLSSAADVALGAFRYCVNTASGFGNDDIAKIIVPSLTKILWGQERTDNVKKVYGRGYNPYPKTIKLPEYARLYTELAEFLGRYTNVDEDPTEQDKVHEP